jgi:phosphoribosylanthranilate isomerase
MALKTLVKVGSISNLSDARYCAGMGVDFLGFRIIEGQPGAIPVKTFQEIRGWVTGPQIVAEIYGVSREEELSRVLEETLPDYLELSMAEYRAIGHAINKPYILRLGDHEEIPSDFPVRPAYLLTGPAVSPTTSRYIPDFELLVEVNALSELDSAIAQTGVSGIALNGGSEIRPGLKNYEALSGILEALEVD